MRIMIFLPPIQTPSPAGVGGRGQEQKKSSVRVLVSTGTCPLEAPSLPRDPRLPVSFTIVPACRPVPHEESSGCSRCSTAGLGLHRKEGLLLLVTSLVCTLLCRVRAQQGSQDAIRSRASSLHLEVGSQGGILPRAPLRGGQRIWKEGRRKSCSGQSRCTQWPLLPVRGGK